MVFIGHQHNLFFLSLLWERGGLTPPLHQWVHLIGVTRLSLLNSMLPPGHEETVYIMVLGFKMPVQEIKFMFDVY